MSIYIGDEIASIEDPDALAGGVKVTINNSGSPVLSGDVYARSLASYRGFQAELLSRFSCHFRNETYESETGSIETVYLWSYDVQQLFEAGA